ncbi:hypothetical protein Tco_1310665 [Tanacetum coccineum]
MDEGVFVTLSNTVAITTVPSDNTVRVNQIVTIFLIESSIHLLNQHRYPVDTSLIDIESRKSPTAELFDVESGRSSIRHCIKLSTLEALKELILKIRGAITLSFFTNVDSREEGVKFEVTSFDKAFDSPTLGITLDLGRGVTEYSFGPKEKSGFPKINCFENLNSKRETLRPRSHLLVSEKKDQGYPIHMEYPYSYP